MEDFPFRLSNVDILTHIASADLFRAGYGYEWVCRIRGRCWRTHRPFRYTDASGENREALSFRSWPGRKAAALERCILTMLDRGRFGKRLWLASGVAGTLVAASLYTDWERGFALQLNDLEIEATFPVRV